MQPALRIKSYVSIIALVICLVAVGCALTPVPTVQLPTVQSEFDAVTTDRAVLEDNTETKIPQDATDIHGFVSGFQELMTLARFTIARTQLEEFLHSTACTLPFETTDVRADMQQLGAHFEWWRPIDARRFQWCGATKEHLYQQVFLDISNDESVIVYIYAGTR